jgi:hypothetical protein
MMTSSEERSKEKSREDDQRPQIVLTMYSTQHILLQSFRQVYLTAQGLLLVAASILIALGRGAGPLVLGLIVCGMSICVIWSGQCCQRGRTWKFFRGYLHKLEDEPSLSVKPLKEYKKFRGARYCRQVTTLEDLGCSRIFWPPWRWSPAVFIDIVLPLFFLIMWGFILWAALSPK